MLSWAYILRRCKYKLQTPNGGVEKTDDELVDYMKDVALKKWEYYYPSTNRITLNTYDDNIKVPNRTSCFYIFDPDGRQVKNVKAIYTDMGDKMLFGHDLYGAWSYDQVPQVALQNQIASNTTLYSTFNYTVRFYPPNICEIMPKFEGKCTIEYEREIDPELSDIIPDLEDFFTELCVSMVMMWIGGLRMKYSTYNTQFGEIQLNGEALYNEGKEIYNQIIEKLQSSYMCMNTTFDHG